MALTPNTAAGADAPAVVASATWVAWRDRADRPLYRVVLWPHRSLGPKGQKTVLGLASAGFTMPLAASAGTPVFWGLLPFCAAAVGVLWLALRRSTRDGTLCEELTLWRDEMRVERREPRGRVLRWRASPGFVRLRIHENARIEAYLTLGGGGREIELGAFLSPDERRALYDEISSALCTAR